jgi:histidyl-tRNA synthetase
MYTFTDKSDRSICLVPEVTAIIQDQFKNVWDKERRKPVRIFYVSRCYRYERPQMGRYREFTQFGVELLGNKDGDRQEIFRIINRLMQLSGVEYQLNNAVKRGLDYYTEEGFEVEVASLGAQKQVAGGGRYDCGIGFAIGIDRLALCTKANTE